MPLVRQTLKNGSANVLASSRMEPASTQLYVFGLTI